MKVNEFGDLPESKNNLVVNEWGDAPEVKASQAFNEFGDLPESSRHTNIRSRTSQEIASDTARAVGMGALSIPEAGVEIGTQVAQGATFGPQKLEKAVLGTTHLSDLINAANNWFSSKIKKEKEKLAGGFSDPTKQRLENLEKAMEEGFISGAKEVITDPALLGHLAAQTLPTMATMAGAARAAYTQTFKRLAASSGAFKAHGAAASASMATLVGTNFVLSGGESGAEVRAMVLSATPEQLSKSPLYQELIKNGVSHKEAVQLLANTAASAATLVSGSISAGATLLTGGGVEQMIAKGSAAKVGAKEVTKAVFRGGFKEASEEIPQSFGEEVGKNVGTSYLDPTQKIITKKAFGAAGVGAVTGFAMGGVGGGVSSFVKGRDEYSRSEIEARLDQLDKVVSSLQDPGLTLQDEPPAPKRAPHELLEMPEVDFPLRQEILQHPAISEAIDNHRRAYAEATTDEERKAVEKSFMAGMRQLGIRNPEDAIGLQPLYESGEKLRYPKGIRKVSGPGTKYAKTPEGNVYTPIKRDIKETYPKKKDQRATKTKIPIADDDIPEGLALPGRLTPTANTDSEGKRWDVEVKKEYFGINQDTVSIWVEARDPDTGVRYGYVDFSQDENGVLSAEAVHVEEPARMRGVAEMMYRAAREKGYSIKPGRAQTPAGHKFVNAMIAKGVIDVYNKEEWVKQATKEVLPDLSVYTDTSLTSLRLGQTKNPDFSEILSHLKIKTAIGAVLKYDKSDGSVDIRELFSFFRPVIEKEAPELIKIWKEVEKILYSIPFDDRPVFRIIEKARYVKFRDRNGNVQSVIGAYFPDFHTIAVGQLGLNARTILHETIHGITSRYIKYFNLNQDVEDLKIIVNVLKNHPNIGHHYGVTNVEEFVAELFTSAAFQKDLSNAVIPKSLFSIIPPAKNMFVGITKKIAEAMGIEIQDTNALFLASVMSASHNLMRQYARDASKINRLYANKIRRRLDTRIPPLPQIEVPPDSLIYNTPVSEEANKVQALKKLPFGMELIPKDPDPIQVIELSKTAPKISDTNLLIGGKTMIAEIKNHPLISATRDWFLNAQKRANLWQREFVRPTEQSINALLQNPSSARLLHSIFMRELKREVPYTVSELDQIGVAPNIINAYVEFRNMMDKAWQAQNDARIEIGLGPLTKREAYISSRWDGPWRTPVYDKTGKLVWYIAEPSKRKAEAALRYLAEHADIDVSKSKIEYRKFGKKGDVAAGYQEMLEILPKNDPRIETLKNIYEEYIQTTGEKMLGQFKHFEPKSGVMGFVGSRPWVESSQDIKEMFQQQFQYAKNAFTWAETQKAVKQIKTVLADTDLQQTQDKALSLARQMAANSLGYGDLAVISDLEHAITKAFGSSPQQLAQAIGAARTFFYWTKLGFFNIPYTMINLVQPLYALPWHVQLSNMGYKHNLLRTFILTGQDASGLYLKVMGVDVKISDIGERAAKYAIANGLIDINAMSDVADVGRSDFVHKIEKIITLNMTEAEKMARSTAFMSFVHHLNQSGQYKNEMDLFKRAEELTNLSMVDYRVSERAKVFNSLGITGSALSTLQTFKINQYNQLYNFAKKAGKDPSPFAAMIAIHLCLAGALGFFAVETADDIWEFIKKQLPDEAYVKVKNFGIKKFILDNLPDVLAYGGASKLTGLIPGAPPEGVNLSSRFDAGSVVEFSVEGLLPFVADIAKQAQAVGTFVTDPQNPVYRDQMLLAISPSAFKGAVEAQSYVFSGNNMAHRISKPEEAVIRRTPEEQRVRHLGVMGLREARTKENIFRTERIIQENQRRLSAVSSSFKREVIFGTPERMAEKALLYVELGGDPAQLVQQIEPAIMGRYIEKYNIIKMKANTNRGLQNFLLYFPQ